MSVQQQQSTVSHHFTQAKKRTATETVKEQSLQQQQQSIPIKPDVIDLTTTTTATTVSGSIPCITNSWSDVSIDEQLLREFDLSVQYGPCSGLTRANRWIRAAELGLNPPQSIWEIIEKHSININNTTNNSTNSSSRSPNKSHSNSNTTDDVSVNSIFENPTARVLEWEGRQ